MSAMALKRVKENHLTLYLVQVNFRHSQPKHNSSLLKVLTKSILEERQLQEVMGCNEANRT